MNAHTFFPAAKPAAYRLPLLPIARWLRVRRERAQLLELNDYMLNDIGLTRAEVQREAARPFWDVPPR